MLLETVFTIGFVRIEWKASSRVVKKKKKLSEKQNIISLIT